jgi:serine/threonine protein kinase
MTSDFAGWPYGAFESLGRGSRIAGYVVEEQVGAGGMAVVFRARHVVLGRLAAVKVIAPSMAGDEEFRARFLRESWAAAAVDSPHIVPVYGAGEDAGLLYIATQFVAGGDLAGLVRSSGGRLAPGLTTALVAQLASALDAAHAAGLVHRDVKPRNVLVDTVSGGSWNAYLSDFGLCKGIQSSAGPTLTGQFVGTPDYSAPERISDDRVDGRADQYALGCVAFALLTGTPPFRRPTALATLFAHVQSPVPTVTGLRPELPPAVDSVIGRALAKSPADRYTRCSEFALALQQALTQIRFPPAGAAAAGSAPPAREGTRNVTRMAAGSSGTHSREQTPHRGRTRGRRQSLALWSAVTATAIAVGIAAAYPLFRSHPGSQPSRPATGASTAPSRATPQVAGAPRVLSGGNYAFKNPVAFAVNDRHLWVVNDTGNSVTELSASDGAWIRTVFGASYGFNDPLGIVSAGTGIWVTNSGNSVTELSASDGAWMRTLSGPGYGLNGPQGITSDGAHVWVANSGGNSVTELSASDGAWMRTLSGPGYGFNSPLAIVADGPHIWVANSGGDSVTELDASDGSWVRTLSHGSYGLNSPMAIVADGPHIWVANSGGDSVTELDASDGSWVRTLSHGKNGFNSPTGIIADGPHVWVANSGSDSVTELNASNGSWVRTLSGPQYSFAGPQALAADGMHVWVASGNSVTQLTN